MLELTINGTEYFNDDTQRFVYPEAVTLHLEHSLVSLSKWEQKHERAFLGDDERTPEEVLSYIQFMIVTEDYPLEALYRMTEENLLQINNYINAKMSATFFNDMAEPAQRRKETLTNELIYYWMSAAGIDISCENWHLNRLFTLIKIVSAKNEKPKKTAPGEMARKRAEMNEARKRKLGTNG